MRVVVCLKWVPRTADAPKAGERPNLLRSDEAVGPSDRVALDTARKLRSAYAARVTCLALGPAEARDALCLGLALGADDALLLRDDGLGAYDAYGAGFLVGRVLRQLDWTLVLCGDRAGNDGSGLFPAALAGALSAPYLSSLAQVEVSADRRYAVAERKREGGLRELWRAPLPAVCSIAATPAAESYVPIGRLFLARRRPIAERDARREWDGAAPLELTRVQEVFPARPRVKRLAIPSASLFPAERMRILATGSVGEKKEGS